MRQGVLETRWIILATDGRHVTMGRHTDPSPAEIEQAEAALAAQGMAGWLAVMKGGYYHQRSPSLVAVRPLCNPQGTFENAAMAFEATRKAAQEPAG